MGGEVQAGGIDLGPDPPVGVVVGVLGDPGGAGPGGLGHGQDPAALVVAVFRAQRQGTYHYRRLATGVVVGDGRGPGRRIGDLHLLALGVVGVFGDQVQAAYVLDTSQDAVGGVIGVAGLRSVRIGHLDEMAAGVILVLDLAAHVVGDEDQIAVGVVLIGFRASAAVSDPHRLVNGVGDGGDHDPFGRGHRHLAIEGRVGEGRGLTGTIGPGQDIAASVIAVAGGQPRAVGRGDDAAGAIIAR